MFVGMLTCDDAEMFGEVLRYAHFDNVEMERFLVQEVILSWPLSMRREEGLREVSGVDSARDLCVHRLDAGRGCSNGIMVSRVFVNMCLLFFLPTAE